MRSLCTQRSQASGQGRRAFLTAEFTSKGILGRLVTSSSTEAWLILREDPLPPIIQGGFAHLWASQEHWLFEPCAFLGWADKHLLLS